MTKVKTPRPNLRNNNKLTIVFGSSIAIIFLLFLLKAYLSKESPAKMITDIFEPEAPKQAPVVVVKQEKLSSALEEKLKAKGMTPNQYLRLRLGNRVIKQHVLDRRKAQAKLIREFKKKVHIDMEFPQAMEYLDLDLDQNVAGIIGTSLDGKKTFAVLATNQKVSLSEALDYVKASQQSFPFMKNHKFMTDKIVSFPAPESTGLKPLTIVPATSHKGQGLYVALSERKDSKGTYLFMIEAPYHYFDANEDGLERMLGTVKAKP
ncbi:MAG: hypothetical protein V4598_04750 [Bdellovibrionota bacterium]